MKIQLAAGSATAVGSLPHLDPVAAAQFSLRELPDLPSLPSLPGRSSAEGMLGQVASGVRGLRIASLSSIEIERGALDPDAPVVTDLSGDAFAGFRAFLEVAAGRTGPVKWQLTGPVTFALALMRAGLPVELAMRVAVPAVRSHLTAIREAVSAALPEAPQLVVLDEPSFPAVMEPEHPLEPELAIDAVSTALAAIEPDAMTGVHCCAPADWPSLIAAGPQVISVPVSPALTAVSGYLGRYLSEGGWIAWGAVPTDGPIPQTVERPWRVLSELWCEMVQGGCDPVLLRSQSLVTPACGLGLHAQPVAERVVRLVGQVAHRVHSQAVATRLSIGA